MSDKPYMPLWVADFLAKTMGLDAREIGAYMLLIMALWSHNGTLPNNPKKLQRIARCGRDWPRVWEAISHFFTVDGDTISQQRVTEELQKMRTKREVNAHNGARGGRAKALKQKEGDLANATVSPEHPYPYPEPYIDSLTSLEGSSNGGSNGKEENGKPLDGGPHQAKANGRNAKAPPAARDCRAGRSYNGAHPAAPSPTPSATEWPRDIEGDLPPAPNFASYSGLHEQARQRSADFVIRQSGVAVTRADRTLDAFRRAAERRRAAKMEQ